MRTSIPSWFLTVCLAWFLASTVNAQTCGCTIAEVASNLVSPCTTTVGNVVNVSTVTEFNNAITAANNQGGNMTILIADGIYPVASTASYPYITGSNIVIRSQTGDRDAVILTGTGMSSVAPDTEIVLSAQGDNITIADLTIRDCGNHGISVQADGLLVRNVRIQNTYEQMLKGTSGGGGSNNGIVQCSLFEYTAGIGPQFYIGGLDIHVGTNWQVRDNIFRDIASPSGSVAEHAVHFWNNSANNTVERNWIVNCDRGIGFGLGSSANTGGMIRNNMIFNDGSDPFHDVGIGLETSPNTEVYNNTVYIAYPNAIEYRFPSTNGVTITNNLCNTSITSRNGGQAALSSNIQNAVGSWFVDIANGDLHLVPGVSQVIDQGTALPGVLDDFDQSPRPTGSTHDIGADEFEPTTGIHAMDNVPFRAYSALPGTLTITGTSGMWSSMVNVYAVSGELIFSGSASSDGVTTVHGLNAGLYLVLVLHGRTGNHTIRVLVE